MKLYDFQEEAVKKFLKTRNVLLGDDMGLGKTVIAIELDKRRRKSEAYHNKRSQSSMKTLVVTLKSLLGSWEEHFKTWNPELSVQVIDTKNRPAFLSAVSGGVACVYIVHWDALRLMGLEKFKWFHIIADETHRIKNRKAQVTVAFKKIKAEYLTDMSGTWADNNPDDGWSTLNHLYPKDWRSYWSFYNHHVLFREKVMPNGNKYREIIGVHDQEGLHEKMEPFYVRRTKVQVLKDLPDKYYTTIRVDLHPAQRRAYNDMRRHMLAWVGEHEQDPVPAPIVVAQLVRLQQFAVAYGELVTTKKFNRAANEYEEVRALRLAEPSAKLDAIMEIIEEASGPVVVFGQSKQAINLLDKRLTAKKVTHGILTGDTNEKDRTRLVAEFQNGLHRVFAGTIKAGGVGLTLTAASTVVFLDRAWSPSVNKQAEDRLHRIGQKNAVQVIDIVANDTIDRERLQRLDLKWEWIKQILGDK